jgi:hypothetical protein
MNSARLSDLLYPAAVIMLVGALTFQLSLIFLKIFL